MTVGEAFALYSILAFVQAIFVARFMKERSAPGLLVCLLTVLAPLVSAGIIFEAITRSVTFLVTYKNK